MWEIIKAQNALQAKIKSLFLEKPQISSINGLNTLFPTVQITLNFHEALIAKNLNSYNNVELWCWAKTVERGAKVFNSIGMSMVL